MVKTFPKAIATFKIIIASLEIKGYDNNLVVEDGNSEQKGDEWAFPKRKRCSKLNLVFRVVDKHNKKKNTNVSHKDIMCIYMKSKSVRHS